MDGQPNVSSRDAAFQITVPYAPTSVAEEYPRHGPLPLLSPLL